MTTTKTNTMKMMISPSEDKTILFENDKPIGFKYVCDKFWYKITENQIKNFEKSFQDIPYFWISKSIDTNSKIKLHDQLLYRK